jgi:excinuclease ABC subunit C
MTSKKITLKSIVEKPLFDAEAFLVSAPLQAGVYKMLDLAGKIIYVGKAKNLKNRLASYFQANQISPKTRVLVSRIADIQYIVTQTENEALLLEQTLIKEYRPRYNVLLRDDKSYPSIYLSAHAFPNLRFTRQRKYRKGRYFGPYSKPSAVKETIELIQKFFKLRNCQDSFFSNRSRPCLQYQIKRCKAPCVNFVSKEEYTEDVQSAILFLEGKNQLIIQSLTEKMQKASKALQFEKALEYREQIHALQSVMQKQYVVGLEQDKDFDIVFAAIDKAVGVVQKLLVRGGNLIDSPSYILQQPLEMTVKEMLDAFLAQHYLSFEEVSQFIYVNEESEEHCVLSEVLTTKQGKHITILQPKRGEKMQWLELARVNALQKLEQHQAKQANYTERFTDLQSLLETLPSCQGRIGKGAGDLPGEGTPLSVALTGDEALINLICFDISHTMGEATVASCVVFNLAGPDKSSYRRFNIEGITGGDDYAAMRQALVRYYEASLIVSGAVQSREECTKETGLLQSQAPSQRREVLLIDGGKGQLRQAEEVLSELNVQDTLVLGIAKGEGRKSGLETIFLNSVGVELKMKDHPQAFLLLQEIRDEAHRFAITGHRNRRDKKRRTSTLETIPGIGPVRRQVLLAYFGGLQGLKEATVEQITKVPGVSQALAIKIKEGIK